MNGKNISTGSTLNALLDTITDNADRLVGVVIHINDTYLIDERPSDRSGSGAACLGASV